MTANTPSGKTRLMTLPSDIRPEKEIISDLQSKLAFLLNEWVITQPIQNAIDSVKVQLENCGLSRKEISEIGIQ